MSRDGPATPLSAETLQGIVDLLPVALSLAQIAEAVGVERHQVRWAAQPFLALMEAGGTLPPCPCGKKRYHRGSCVVLAAPMRGQGTPEQLRRRAMFVDLLVAGLSYQEIGEIMGTHRSTPKEYSRYLSLPQLAERRRLMYALRSATRAAGQRLAA